MLSLLLLAAIPFSPTACDRVDGLVAEHSLGNSQSAAQECGAQNHHALLVVATILHEHHEVFPARLGSVSATEDFVARLPVSLNVGPRDGLDCWFAHGFAFHDSFSRTHCTSGGNSDFSAIDRVDLLERNGVLCHGESGTHLAIEQWIAWDWCERRCCYTVRDYRLHREGMAAVKNPATGEYVLRWLDSDGVTWREVMAGQYRERICVGDVEVRERENVPCERRRKFFRRGM